MNAATFEYVSGASVTNGVSRSTGPKPRMTGGSAYTVLGFGTTTIITYRPAPGYVEIGSATTNNPHEAYISHGSASNASSKCYWYNSSVDLAAKAEMMYRIVSILID